MSNQKHNNKIMYLIILVLCMPLVNAASTSYVPVTKGLFESVFSGANISGDLWVTGDMMAESFTLTNGSNCCGLGGGGGATYYSSSNISISGGNVISINMSIPQNTYNSSTDIINAINQSSYYFGFKVHWNNILGIPSYVIDWTDSISSINNLSNSSILNLTNIYNDTSYIDARISSMANTSAFSYSGMDWYNGSQVNSSIYNITYNLMGNTSNITCYYSVDKWYCYINGTIASSFDYSGMGWINQTYADNINASARGYIDDRVNSIANYSNLNNISQSYVDTSISTNISNLTAYMNSRVDSIQNTTVNFSYSSMDWQNGTQVNDSITSSKISEDYANKTYVNNRVNSINNITNINNVSQSYVDTSISTNISNLTAYMNSRVDSIQNTTVNFSYSSMDWYNGSQVNNSITNKLSLSNGSYAADTLDGQHGSYYLDNTDYCADGTCDGNLIVNGNFTVIGSKVELNVTEQKLNGSFYPQIDSLFDIGSYEKKWNNIFGVTLYGNLGCGNITGSTSNLCTLTDTDTYNTTSDVLKAAQPINMTANIQALGFCLSDSMNNISMQQINNSIGNWSLDRAYYQERNNAYNNQNFSSSFASSITEQDFVNKTYVNNTIDSKLSGNTWFFVKNHTAIGTAQGDITLTQESYDSNSLNLTEAAVTGLTYYANTSNNVTTAVSQICIRYIAIGNNFNLYLWDTDDSDWESYGALTENSVFSWLCFSIRNADDHVIDNKIALKLQNSGSASTQHKLKLENMYVSSGYSIQTSNEVDPIWTADKPNYQDRASAFNQDNLSSALWNGTLLIKANMTYHEQNFKHGNTSSEIFNVANNGTLLTKANITYHEQTFKHGNTTEEIFNVVNNGTLLTKANITYHEQNFKHGNTSFEIFNTVNNGTLLNNISKQVCTGTQKISAYNNSLFYCTDDAGDFSAEDFANKTYVINANVTMKDYTDNRIASIANYSNLNNISQSYVDTSISTNISNLTAYMNSRVDSIQNTTVNFSYSSMDWYNGSQVNASITSSKTLEDYANKTFARNVNASARLYTDDRVNSMSNATNGTIRSGFISSSNITYNAATGEFYYNGTTGSGASFADEDFANKTYVNNANTTMKDYADARIQSIFNVSWSLINNSIGNWSLDKTWIFLSYQDKVSAFNNVNLSAALWNGTLLTKANMTYHEQNFKHGNTTEEIFNVVNNGTLLTKANMTYHEQNFKHGNTSSEIFNTVNNGTLLNNISKQVCTGTQKISAYNNSLFYCTDDSGDFSAESFANKTYVNNAMIGNISNLTSFMNSRVNSNFNTSWNLINNSIGNWSLDKARYQDRASAYNGSNHTVSSSGHSTFLVNGTNSRFGITNITINITFADMGIWQNGTGTGSSICIGSC
jgi:hypothetical protein